MAIGNGRDRDPGTGGTVRGALLIIVAALALAVAYNALGLASRPPHGLSWIAGPDTTRSLEALQPALSTANPADTTGPATHPAPETPTAAPPANAASGAAPRTDPAPAPRPSTSPAQPATATPDAAPAPAAGLPVIPDVAGPLKLELASLKKLYDADAVLVLDSREADEYAAGHIAGAVSLPYNDVLADPGKARRLDSGGRAIVVYCSGEDCELSMDLAKVLIQSGKKKLLVYEGGYPEWSAAGYPVVHGPAAGGNR
jgi:rhodanese-related sulfurtransferase